MRGSGGRSPQERISRPVVPPGLLFKLSCPRIARFPVRIEFWRSTPESLHRFARSNALVFYNAEVAMIFAVFFAMDAAQKHADCRLPELQGQREDTWSSLYRFFRARRWKRGT